VGFLVVLAAAWVAEVALAKGSEGHGGRQCPGATMPDCGGVNHSVFLGAFFTLSLCVSPATLAAVASREPRVPRSRAVCLG